MSGNGEASVRDRILLVDDEPQILVALEDVLSEQFVVFKAESGESALQLLARERDIAVVVTDQRMPKMTGDQLLANLAASFDASRIMVTGFADLSAVIRAVNDGRIFAYVTKPWNPDDLCLKVAKAAEHFRLAKELEYERQLLHDLMDNIPDGIYFKGRDLRFLRANRAFASFLGAESAEELVDKRSNEFHAGQIDVPSTEGEEKKILAEGIPARDVVRAYRNGDTRRYFSETKAAVRSREGRIMGLVGIARDVTERVENAHALEESEKRYRKQSQILNSILEGMGEGVVVTDPAGRFIIFNRQAKAILGVGTSDAIPARWTETYGTYLADRKTLVTPDQHPLARAMKGEEVRNVELFVQNDVVSGATLAVTATPLEYEESGGTGGVAVVRDVTEQRHLEEQLLQAQKMEAIGQLAGGIAHDFNNLLLVMQSCAEFVLQDLPEGDQKREDVGEILAAARRAGSLTRQLLAFSRRQASQPKALDLNQVVADIEKMLRRLIGENVDLTASLSPGLGIVWADAGQMEQVIVNLTVNARDAMPDGGRLTIRTSNVELHDDDASYPGVAKGPYVLLTVNDTGTGMDAATQKRAFEPFFTTKDVGKGTGLGLSTVYGIVQQSGGHIRLESELGRGTCFKIYLARVDAGVDVSAPRRPRTVPIKGSGTILLVEDDDAVRHVAARILRDSGYTVLETRRPSEALSICAEGKGAVDLLLTDIVMPETSGPKLAEQLSAIHPTIRVVYMSGYSGVAPAAEHTLVGSAGYIEKPFAASALAEKVREALEGPLKPRLSSAPHGLGPTP